MTEDAASKKKTFDHFIIPPDDGGGTEFFTHLTLVWKYVPSVLTHTKNQSSMSSIILVWCLVAVLQVCVSAPPLPPPRPLPQSEGYNKSRLFWI